MSVWPSVAVAVALLLATLAVAAAAVAVFAARQARVQNLPDVVSIRAVAMEARQEALAVRAEWKATLGALDAAFEALDDKADTIGRRRKRAEMAERRRSNGEAREAEREEEADPMEAAMMRARAQGLPV